MAPLELPLSRLLDEPRLELSAPLPLGALELPDGLLEPLRGEPLDEPLPSELPEPEELLPASEEPRPLPDEPVPSESELEEPLPAPERDEPAPEEPPPREEPEPELDEPLPEPVPEELRPLPEEPLPSEPEPELEDPAPEPVSLDEELLLLPLPPGLEVVPELELPIEADDNEMPNALAV